MDWDRLSERWPLIRDVMIVVTALGLIIFEALYGGPVRQSLLLLYSGLLVTPVFLRKDERRSNDQPHTPEEPGEVGP